MADRSDPALASLYPAAGEVPAAFRPRKEDHPPRFLVDGRIEPFAGRAVTSKVALRSGASLEFPAVGEEPALGAAEALRAVAAAERAWGGGRGEWPAMPEGRRLEAVERFAARLEAAAEPAAALLMFEIGKPYRSARDEVVRSVEYIRNTLAEFRRLADGARATFSGKAGKNTHHGRELRRPLGIVLCVAPFNYPVNEFLTTVVPALLMGNVVIGKTPRFGMLANQLLLSSFAECFPPGSVSILPGDGRAVIPPIMGSGKVDVLAFIGSEGAANAILKSHPSPISLHKILGLGAKNPAIVLDGADLDQAAAAITRGALGFNGQRCTAEKLVLAPRAKAEGLARRIAERVAALKVGMPWEEGVALTPLPEDGKLQAMWAFLDDAEARGARILNPGGGTGFCSILRPAVLFPVDPGMRIFHEEQFGPIVPVAPYDEIGQVLEWQKASPYGQQAGIWGPVEAARPVVEAMGRFVARVNLNDVCQRGPDSFGFTATDKSGFGTLSLRDALLSLSRPLTLQCPDEAALRSL
jgi:glyceraldehyde-3-phosphate dehydrogenase (NADP+)